MQISGSRIVGHNEDTPPASSRWEHRLEGRVSYVTRATAHCEQTHKVGKLDKRTAPVCQFSMSVIACGC